MNSEKRIKKIIDNLSVKYDFFYLIKKHKKTSTVLFILYFIFVLYVIEKIYIKHQLQGIIDNLLPLFVDIALIFIITVIFLTIRTIYNDEGGRIDESKEENKNIRLKVPFNLSMHEIEIQFNKSNYYTQPQLIYNLLRWVDFDKDDYFRTHYGALDISKISLTQLTKNNDKLILHCNQSSFYDIAYTHYFPDYELSLSSSTDAKSTTTLRSLLSPNIEASYTHKLRDKALFDLPLSDLLPNPIGVTGIVTLKGKQETYYLLQIRHKHEAAAKDKIQWSFAGTIDTVPGLYKDTIDFVELIENELVDEVRESESATVKLLKNYINQKDVIADYRLIGFVLNPLYLYQPEFYVNVTFEIQDDELEAEIQKRSITYKQRKYQLDNYLDTDFYAHITDKNDKLLIIAGHHTLHAIKNDENISTRNLFTPGLEFMEQSEGIKST